MRRIIGKHNIKLTPVLSDIFSNWKQFCHFVFGAHCLALKTVIQKCEKFEHIKGKYCIQDRIDIYADMKPFSFSFLVSCTLFNDSERFLSITIVCQRTWSLNKFAIESVSHSYLI